MNKKVFLVGAVSACIVSLSLLGFSNRSEGSHATYVAAPVMTVPAIEPAIEIQSPTLSPQEKQNAQHLQDVRILSSYVQDLMLKWVPAKNMPLHDVSHYASIAYDISTIALDPKEKGVFPGGDQWKNAVLLATIGDWEGHYWKHVDDGRCNDKVFRASQSGKDLLGRTGDCDGGHAYSIFQIHPEGGIALTDDGLWTHLAKKPGDPSSADGADLVSDRQVAARTALHMLRASLRSNGSLCAYSGERRPCVKAIKRLEFALLWMRKQPFPAWRAAHVQADPSAVAENL